MGADNFSSVLESVLSALFLAVSIYVYAALVRKVQARATEPPLPTASVYGWPEATVAILLCLWFLLNIVFSATHQVTTLQTPELVLNALFPIGLFLVIAGFLWLRGFDVGALGGFSRMGFGRTLATGGLLLLAAYPLVLLAEVITQKIGGGSFEKQEIIEVFNASSTIRQRILIIVLAVSIAPMTEEFFFRFFLYGVAKRYFGRSVGVLANSILFAAVHLHLPSFGPLFILGVCLTIAYEWSGSIIVSMTMHALFNTLAMIALAFPEVFPQ